VQQNSIITLQNDRQTLKEEMSLSVVTRYWTDFIIIIIIFLTLVKTRVGKIKKGRKRFEVEN